MDSAASGRVHALLAEAVAAIAVPRLAAVVGRPSEEEAVLRRELEVPQMAVVTPLCTPGEYVASVVALETRKLVSLMILDVIIIIPRN